MKLQNKWLVGAIMGITVGIAATSCVDEIKFGNAFLEKAPGGAATIDTVFNNAEYTRQFLTACYSRQYYGLPYINKNQEDGVPETSNPYLGKFEALTDCWQLHYTSTTIYNRYYNGSLTPNNDQRGSIFGYTREMVWEVVRWCWILMENIEGVPGMDATEKAKLVAEAKCLIAARYFDLFRHYGGLPLLYASFSGTESSYSMPRATVEETVNYMVSLLDDAINSGALEWAYNGNTGSTNSTNTGRWTRAGAMALKCKILQFAASPLFNADRGYAGGGSEAEQKLLVWYGGYRADLWTRCLEACRAFFNAVNSNGYYELNQATGSSPTPADYRYAYRMGYIELDSPEVLHSVRVHGYDSFGAGSYCWHSWSDNGRNSYTPTQEYVEMFPWSDGTPFDWDKTEAEGRLDEMFLTGTFNDGQQLLSNIVFTRDPRLYESVIVNGLPGNLGWSSVSVGGDPYELWVGGSHAGTNSQYETMRYATGYDNMKYYLGPSDYLRQNTQWVALRLSDLYLTYAEALLQANNDHQGAIDQIDIVRARVGLPGLVQSNPDKRLLTDKDALLEELLRERACELGLEDSRFFDLIRYKRADRFEKQLHGLLTYRLDEDGGRIDKPWRDGTDDTGKNKGALQPTRFQYEKFELKNSRRYWWLYGFEPKWYLSPFPLTEVNKGYGLIQNPGW
ncbi:MAG: RagB/SusD family nutrient uptake outer membrane protein [Bacteroides xylanisolvens]